MRRPLFLAALVLLPLAACKEAAPPEAILIGHLNVGQEEIRAIDFALEEVEKNSPLGRPVKVVHAEVAGDPPQIEAQTIRLIQFYHPIAVLGSWGTDIQAIGRGIGNDPVLGFGSSNPKNALLGAYLFDTSWGQKQSASIVLDWLNQRTVPSKLTIGWHYSNETFLAELRKALVDSKTISWIKDEEVPNVAIAPPEDKLDEYYFRSLKLIETKDGRHTTTGKKMTILKLTGHSLDYPDTKDLVRMVIKAGSEIFILSRTAETPARKALQERYLHQYSEAPTEAFFNAYMNVEILTEAIRRANSAIPLKIKEELLKKDKPFDTVLGRVIFDADQGIRFLDAKFVPYTE